jgi:hypothetical protein
MTKLRLNITMSLDGYVAGPHQSVTHPLGEGATNGRPRRALSAWSMAWKAAEVLN